METKKKIEKIIYSWVDRNFGPHEAQDPSWNIEALADEIAKHQHELYWGQEPECLKEYVKGD